jgi:hypothetical protein
MRRASLVTRSSCALAAALIALIPAVSATADEVPAEGSFTFTTGPGILPAWDSAGISIVGVSPGSVITNTSAKTARVILPLVAKAGTANAAAGGFRFLNTETGDSFRCSNPTIDTRARVIDCVLPSGYNSTVFAITDIEGRAKANTDTTKTTIFQGMRIQIINREMANRLNDELDTNVFSTSVILADASLIVTRDR